jgi:hypothetical protein
VVGLAVCAAYALLYCRPSVKNVAAMCSMGISAYAASWVPLLVREHRTAYYLITANTFIFEYHRHINAIHPFLSQSWWLWIFRFKPDPDLTYLIANPVIVLLGLPAIGVLLWQRKPLLPALYLAHIMQWAIAIRPQTFYYYYLEAFTWLTLALAVALQNISIRRVRLDVMATGFAAAMFARWYLQWYAQFYGM